MKLIILLLLGTTVACSSSVKKEVQTTKIEPVIESSPIMEDKRNLTERTIAVQAEPNFFEVGDSSWYGEQFQNKPTASGELFDKYALTAAHKTLPLGTEIKVHNLDNNKEAIVRINDRGPFVKNRIIDVSEKVAELLDFKELGTTRVGLTLINSENILVKDDDFFIDDDEDEDDELDDDDIVPIKPPKKDDKQNPSTKTDKKVVPNNNPPTTITKEPTTNTSKVIEGQPKGYTVQIGVFKDKKRADNFKNDLRSIFKEPIYIFNRSGTFVVQIGDYPNRNDAVTLRDQLKSKNIFGFIPPK
jgi:rare lipoprotein A